MSEKTNWEDSTSDTVKDVNVANRDLIIKKPITEITDDGDLQSAIPAAADWTVEDGKKGSLRMYAQDNSGGTSNDYRNSY